jgi:hypothetical protein
MLAFNCVHGAMGGFTGEQRCTRWFARWCTARTSVLQPQPVGALFLSRAYRVPMPSPRCPRLPPPFVAGFTVGTVDNTVVWIPITVVAGQVRT